MIRRSVVAAMILAAVAVGPTYPADAARSPVCPIDWRRGPHAVEQLVRCEAIHWHTPGGPDFAAHVAWCESRFAPHPAREGSYHGVFQIGWREWHGWPRPPYYRRWRWPAVELWGSDYGIWNGRANIVRALAYVHRAGWGAWSCA